jgi:Flp pilus assembly protein TadG
MAADRRCRLRPRAGRRPRLGRAAPASRAGTDRGSAAVELVLLAPALLLVVLVLVQAALYLHARHVLLAAARHGARVARAADQADPAGAGRAAALAAVGRLGPQLVSAPAVAVDRDAEVAAVTLTGQAVSIVPGITLRIRQRSAGPVERFVPLPGSAAPGAGP